MSDEQATSERLKRLIAELHALADELEERRDTVRRLEEDTVDLLEALREKLGPTECGARP